ncbi:putative lipid-binding transport protein (Tim44 family) [Paraburkholderia youngii]|uniref:hypothetical protein n=1 Tax=Paraburkholderia youngii TaxID=2782701 RepID=UPI003D24E293
MVNRMKKRISDFLQSAERTFMRMQYIWDAGNLHEIKHLVGERLLTRLENDLILRGSIANYTDVTELRSELVSDFDDKIGKTVVVKFLGYVREEVDADAAYFVDIWEFCRVDDGAVRWRIDDVKVIV